MDKRKMANIRTRVSTAGVGGQPGLHKTKIINKTKEKKTRLTTDTREKKYVSYLK